MQRLRSKLLRLRRRDTHGQAMVEFILSILLVMVLIFWIWEVVMLVYTYTVIADAAKDGVRFAIVHGCYNQATAPTTPASPGCQGPGACDTLIPNTCDSTADAVVAAVQDKAKWSLHNIAGMTVTVTYPDASSMPGNRVRVAVQYPYVPYITLGWTPPTLKAAAEARIAN